MSEPTKNENKPGDSKPSEIKPAASPAGPPPAPGTPTSAPDAKGAPAPAPVPAAAAAGAMAPAAPAKPAAPPAPPPSPQEVARLARVQKEKDLANKLATKLGDLVRARDSFRDQETIVVDRARALDSLKAAKEVGYDVLADVTAVDYLKLEGHPERFGVIWNLLSTREEARLRVKTYLPEEDPRIGTAADLWPAAEWGEREVYDMFGIEFTDHPDLRRILMPFDYSGYPLRKDYPLRGRGERDNFVVLKRGQREAEV